MKQPGRPSTTSLSPPRAPAKLPSLSLPSLSLLAILLGACGPGAEGEIVLPSLGEASPYTTVSTGVSMSGSGSNTSTQSNEDSVADRSSSVSSSGEPSTGGDGSVSSPEPESESNPEPDPESNLEPDPGPDVTPDPDPQPDTESTTATPEPVACSAPDDSLQARFLERVNAARAQARSCGSTAFDPAPPVIWNDRLASAATAHSSDMARHNFFSHAGSDGSSVATRVDAADYRWRTVGENIAAGQHSVGEAVDGWIASPGHCSNLMNPAFVDIALACVSDDNSDYRVYWTNVLAAPR